MLVPPMSMVMKSGMPHERATFVAPTTPPAGPEKKVLIGTRRRVCGETSPPLDWIM